METVPTASVLTVVGARDLPGARIDRYVSDHPAGSVFHTCDWAALVEDTVGAHVCSLAALREGEVAGLVPLASVWSPIRGRRLLSFPFSRYVPILAESEIVASELVARAAVLARRIGASYLELRCGESSPGRTSSGDPLPRPVATTAAWSNVPAFDNYSLSLADGRETVERHLHPRSARHSIRLSARRGVEVRWVDPVGAVSELRRLELLTRKRQGSTAYPRRFFAALVRHFGSPPGRLWVGLAMRRGEVLAAEVALRSGATVHGILGLDSGARAREARCGHALLWAAIERACAEGARWFDLGPAHRKNDGLVAFKRSFGAGSVPAYAMILPLRGRAPADDNLEGHTVRFARSGLRSLPPRLLALASEWLGREVM